MSAKTPITVITGPLGGGKTTLLRYLLERTDRRLAIVMNEFGEIAIDNQVIQGKNIQMTELGGGCVCCSLAGEFEAAVNEIIDSVHPEQIVLETTGVAEPGALVFDIQENLPRVRLDGVVSIIDADGLLRFPALGHTLQLQIEEADLLVLNKIDLVIATDVDQLESNLRRINPEAPIVRAVRCNIDLQLLFGWSREHQTAPSHQPHQHAFESFAFETSGMFDRTCFEGLVRGLGPEVFRAKGFIHFDSGSFLFNYVRGRWEFESFEHEGNELVFIGPEVKSQESAITNALRQCILR